VNNEIKTGLWFNTRRQILSPLSQIIQSKDKNRTRQKILYAVKFGLIITLRMVHEVQLRSLNVYDNNKGNMTESIRYPVNSLDLQGGQMLRYLSLTCANFSRYDPNVCLIFRLRFQVTKGYPKRAQRHAISTEHTKKYYS
jgi:hypothetical protein